MRTATSLVRSLTLLAVTCSLAFGAAAQSGGAGSPALQRANALMAQGQYASAAGAFREILDGDGANAAAWFGLGYCRHAQGEMEGALEAHAKAAGTPAYAATASYNAACACARLGRVDEAFGWLARARAAGFVNWAIVATDTDLDALRGDDRLQACLPPPADSAQPFAEDVRIVHDLYGEAAGDQYGWVARALGDCDGDGVGDFACTAPFHGGGAGAVYVHSGKSGAVLARVVGKAGDKLGWCVAGAGDLDGDGKADFVAGAPGPATAPGTVRAFSGADGRLLHAWLGEAAGDSFGKDARGVGDHDGDGVQEILIGAPQHDAAGQDAGRAYLFSGRTHELLHAFDGERAGDQLGGGELAGHAQGEGLLVVSAMNAGPQNQGVVHAWSGAPGFAPRFTFAGDATSQNLGWFMSIVGDADADGTLDVLATDWHDTRRGALTGRGWVLSGKDGAVLLDLAGERPGGGFGIGEGAAGDLDRDGHADVVLGAWQNGDGAPQGGKVLVFSGADGSTLGTLTGRIPGDVLGFDATGIGDVDLDGVPDLLVTSAYNAARGVKAGRAYVVSGASCLARPRAR
jgi:hypothetical protein